MLGGEQEGGGNPGRVADTRTRKNSFNEPSSYYAFLGVGVYDF